MSGYPNLKSAELYNHSQGSCRLLQAEMDLLQTLLPRLHPNLGVSFSVSGASSESSDFARVPKTDFNISLTDLCEQSSFGCPG